MVAYIDFFLGGDEKRVDMVSIIQKRFPMCILFGGDGSYMSPYSLHSDTLLTNLLGQVSSLCLRGFYTKISTLKSPKRSPNDYSSTSHRVFGTGLLLV
jgi:hypothetical protein